MLFDDTFHTIKNNSEGIYKEKGSKFIAYAFPVKTEAGCKEIISGLKKEHHSARHHCYAYRLGADMQTWRANDDGEPGNTAGKPILGQIQSKGLTNILVVVVRYFGGTLLGVGGLINAYKQAAADALSNSEIIEEHITFNFEIEFDFEKMNDVMKILKANECKINAHLAGESKGTLISFTVRKMYLEKVEDAFMKLGIKLRNAVT